MLPALRLALLATALALVACGDNSPAPAASAAPGAGPRAVEVEARVIEPSELTRELTAVGSLRSEESVTLSSEIAGRVLRINFTEGQPVAAGQLLFELDASIYRAELEQARANLQLARRNSERADELFSQNLISTADRDTAAANLAVNQSALSLAQARHDKTRITAPFAGVAGLRTVSPGDYVNPGQPLVNLEALQSLKLDLRVPEAALPVLSVGQALTVELDAYPGERFTGTLYAMDPRISDTTRSIALRARLPNPDGKLRPGLFARVRIAVETKQAALMVPEEAIFPRGEQLFVYVIEDGKAAIREVRVGQRQPGRAEVVSGLRAGETVITVGLQKIGPGTAVVARPTISAS
ncbi:MAG: efflux RND transporter periplasmic adaptor subunit [Gammaproteobacteria bacterium]